MRADIKQKTNVWRRRITLFTFFHYKVQTNKGQPHYLHKTYSENNRLKSVSVNKVFVPLLIVYRNHRSAWNTAIVIIVDNWKPASWSTKLKT